MADKNAIRPIRQIFMPFGVTIIGLMVLTMIGCNESQKSPDEATITKPSQSSTTQLVSCEFEQMKTLELKGVSWEEAGHVCEVVSASLGRPPTVGLLTNMAKAVFVFQANGLKDEPKDISYQLMNITEARGNTTEDAINKTTDVVFKCFGGSQGHVTPRDININLRAAGPLAKTMSDDGIFGMCALIQEDKKSRGE